MKRINKLCYGVSEKLPYKKRYIRKIIIENYINSDNVKEIMDHLGKLYKFYQYNSDNLKAYECDFFFWQYVGDYNIKNWQSVSLCCYNYNMSYNDNMIKLLNDIIYDKSLKDNDSNILVYYDDINNLMDKIESETNFGRK